MVLINLRGPTSFFSFFVFHQSRSSLLLPLELKSEDSLHFLASVSAPASPFISIFLNVRSLCCHSSFNGLKETQTEPVEPRMTSGFGDAVVSQCGAFRRRLFSRLCHVWTALKKKESERSPLQQLLRKTVPL